MRATTEFFKMPRDGVIPPGEGVMGVTNKEEARLRVELAAVEKERDEAQKAASEMFAKGNSLAAELRKERDDVTENRDHWRQAYVELDINYRRALDMIDKMQKEGR